MLLGFYLYLFLGMDLSGKDLGLYLDHKVVMSIL